MELKAVIFDLDGTLVDTKEEYIHELFQEVMRCFNIRVSREEALNFWYGHERSEFLKREYGIEPDVFWNKFNNLASKDLSNRLSNTYAYPDAEEAITGLKKQGVRIGVVTNSPGFVSTRELRLLQGVQFDSVINAGYADLKPKPHPGALHKCLEELTINAGEAVFVGNGLEDVRAGRNAGIKTVLVDRKDYQKGFNHEVRINNLTHLLKETFLNTLF